MHSFKIIIMLMLTALMVVFNNCGSPFGSPSPLYFKSNVYGGSAQASYEAFAQTVYPITRSNCVSCHNTQQPAHASDDIKIAHDAILSNFKVNFANIPASRMVKKLRDENHNCWGDCEENAQEMEEAITEWNELIKDSSPVDPVDQEETTPELKTNESAVLAQEFANAQNGIKLNIVNLGMDAAMLNPPMERITNSMEGSFLTVPNLLNNTLSATDPNAGSASLNFTVRQNSSAYRIWGLVNAPNLSDNGFYLNITTTSAGVKEWEIPVTNGWEWRQLTNNTFNLTTGNHSLQIRQRKDGTKIKQVVITADNTFNGTTAADLTGITLTYDLSSILKVPGITFKVDVIDFDPYSYKFQNPRIVTTAVDVKVKNVKLLINGSYNPQHSTFTLIDKVAKPADGKLSDFAMLAIKENGLYGDKISFSFEILQLDNGVVIDPNLAISQEAYRTSVWAVSRTSCVNCHTTQNPPHAHSDYKAAHDEVLIQNLVNFTTPSNSKLVTKVKGRHNCGTQTQCDAIAAQFEAAITQWKNARP